MVAGPGLKLFRKLAGGGLAQMNIVLDKPSVVPGPNQAGEGDTFTVSVDSTHAGRWEQVFEPGFSSEPVTIETPASPTTRVILPGGVVEQPTGSVRLDYALTTQRADYAPLDGARVSKGIAVEAVATGVEGFDWVDFYITVQGGTEQYERRETAGSAFDLKGASASDVPNLWLPANGTHTVRAVAQIAGTSRTVETIATFEMQAVVATGGKIRFAPPGWPDYKGFQDMHFTSRPSGGEIKLRNDTKYRLFFDRKFVGHTEIKGGDDVAAFGLEVEIADLGTSAALFDSPRTRHALDIWDEGGIAGTGSVRLGRIFHLEGSYLWGVDMADAINTRLPQTIMQWCYSRTGLSTYRSMDDRNGTGKYSPTGSTTENPREWTHADTWQPIFGIRELRCHKIYGETAYQGFFLKHAEQGAGIHPRYYFDEIHMNAPDTVLRGDDPSRPSATGGGITVRANSLFWLAWEAGKPEQAAGDVFIKDFYVQRGNDNPNTNGLVRGRGTDETSWTQNSDGTWTWNILNPKTGKRWVKDLLDQTQPGRWRKGAPPAPFVPVGAVGAGYRNEIGYMGAAA